MDKPTGITRGKVSCSVRNLMLLFLINCTLCFIILVRSYSRFRCTRHGGHGQPLPYSSGCVGWINNKLHEIFVVMPLFKVCFYKNIAPVQSMFPVLKLFLLLVKLIKMPTNCTLREICLVSQNKLNVISHVFFLNAFF